MLELNNSRDIVPSHNTRNTTASRSLRYHSKSCRPRTSKAYKSYATTSLSDAAPKPPVEIQFQTAWRKPRAAKRQAPSTLTARRHASQWFSRMVYIAWRVNHHHKALHQYSHNTGFGTSVQIVTLILASKHPVTFTKLLTTYYTVFNSITS